MYLRGHANILKRLLVHVCGLKLSLLMRYLTGVGSAASRGRRHPRRRPDPSGEPLLAPRIEFSGAHSVRAMGSVEDWPHDTGSSTLFGPRHT